MPPSTFASAAAGNNPSLNSTRDAVSEWSRRTNGATQTFRRPSGAATSLTPTPTTAQHPDSLASQPPRYVPPHRNGTLPDSHARYTKEQMLELFRMHVDADTLSDGLANVFLPGWQPDVANGTSGNWGRSEYARDTQAGPEACWDTTGSVEPLGLLDMDDEERELFMTSVNSPIKPLTTGKENAQSNNGLPGRKVSISTSATTPGAFGLPSPNVTRASGRRRETSESYPFPQNNLSTTAAFSRDEPRAASPPPALLRRRTDLKDSKQAEDNVDDDDKSLSAAFGSLRRNPTGPLSAGFNAPSSPWSTGPQSAGLPPMGSFGSFGQSGGAGQPTASTEKRPGLGAGRAESRFKNLLNKESSEDIGQRSMERKTSVSSLSRVNENESWRAHDRLEPANDALDEAEEHLPSGSAALAADADVSPSHPRQAYRAFGTPSRQGTQADFGFGAFGMTSDNTHGVLQGLNPARETFQQTPAQQRMAQQGSIEPMSPTDTNPYQSPEHHNIDRMAHDAGDEGHDAHTTHLPGLGHLAAGDPSQLLGGLGNIGALPMLGRHSGVHGAASDRSQTSSAGANRGFSGLGGLGQLGSVAGSAAWPASQGGLGTPNRQTAGLNNPFGGVPLSNTLADVQSPSLAGLGGAGSLLSLQSGPYGGSRMASMFPPAMQDSMRQGGESERDPGIDLSGPGFAGLGEFGRAGESPFGNPSFSQMSELKSQQELADVQQGQFGAPGQQAQPPEQQPQAPNQPPSSSASNQPPAPQQRTMVMPDRMRWIYRDPQGQTQGPWTGLEMHDWYKAGFFSPELLVKKFEDPDYEPLAQLIRRIGNSREPFLVPQIGIPHGLPTSAGPNAWAGSGPVAPSAGGAQPPFASSFPSFGTTLTAEQQNALERRKQEEQYLMARQKEHLAQAQIAQRMQLQGGGHPGLAPTQLHHHSSAHSLQSQPSFGSMTSPTGYQPSPVQGSSASVQQAPAQGFFDNSFRSPQPSGGLGAVGSGADSLGRIREEEIPGILDRTNPNESRTGAGHFGAPGQRYGSVQQAQAHPEHELHEQQVQEMLQDRARLKQEQAEYDAQPQSHDPQQMTSDRLQQFHNLQIQDGGRLQSEAEDVAKPRSQPPTQEASAVWSGIGSSHMLDQKQQQRLPQEPLSLTEQVQKAASAKHSPAPQHAGIPHPFPPAPSQSPLPAPSAQRASRPSVADQLQTESRDHSQTPSTETPSAAVAPWAKEPAETTKGPTLREIQESEAKKAAEAEELAAAARRAAFQREMEAQVQTTVAQPGLPTSSTWGAGSPATPTGLTAAAWAKSAQKTTGPNVSKTLAQIQKEEEARKRKQTAAAQQNAVASGAVSAPAVGKSYANLAGKITSPAPNASVGGGAWTTVGAGGKSKTPAGPPTPATGRTVSSGVVPTVQVPTARKPLARNNTIGTPGAVNAQDEFKKWAVNELRPDLNKGINAEDFVSGLLVFPPEADIITEAVHGVSSTIDSRHFAEEFIRRKRLADKGLIDNTVPKSGSPSQAGDKGAGGWSQVAKKGPAKEEPKEEANGNFRVVPSKKKVGKR